MLPMYEWRSVFFLSLSLSLSMVHFLSSHGRNKGLTLSRSEMRGLGVLSHFVLGVKSKDQSRKCKPSFLKCIFARITIRVLGTPLSLFLFSRSQISLFKPILILAPRTDRQERKTSRRGEMEIPSFALYPFIRERNIFSKTEKSTTR